MASISIVGSPDRIDSKRTLSVPSSSLSSSSLLFSLSSSLLSSSLLSPLLSSLNFAGAFDSLGNNWCLWSHKKQEIWKPQPTTCSWCQILNDGWNWDWERPCKMRRAKTYLGNDSDDDFPEFYSFDCCAVTIWTNTLKTPLWTTVLYWIIRTKEKNEIGHVLSLFSQSQSLSSHPFHQNVISQWKNQRSRNRKLTPCDRMFGVPLCQHRNQKYKIFGRVCMFMKFENEIVNVFPSAIVSPIVLSNLTSLKKLDTAVKFKSQTCLLETNDIHYHSVEI